MKPYTPVDPTPEEEARMKELRQQCVIESYGPHRVYVNLSNPWNSTMSIESAYGQICIAGYVFNEGRSRGEITPEVIAAARARLMLSLLELDLLERGIKAMEE